MTLDTAKLSLICAGFMPPFCTNQLIFYSQYRPLCALRFSDPVLRSLLSHIQDPKLSSVSASAIESLCMSCHSHMTKYFDVLAQVNIFFL